MSLTISKPSGCSACLVAAIENRDEAAVCRMLADLKVQYADTVLLLIPMPLDSQFNLIEPVPGKIQYVSCIPAKSLHFGDDICPHQSLATGQNLKLCFISVLLMAMLFSTTDFNALQILIESGRFDMREPLIFHQFDMDKRMCNLIVVNALGMALLIDTVKYENATAYGRFLLTRTLLDASVASLDDEFVFVNYDSKEWCAFRARGPITFLFGCDCKQINLQHYMSFNASSNRALVEMLCRVGFELPNSLVITCEYIRRRVHFFTRTETVFNALAIIINRSSSYYIQKAPTEYDTTRLLRMGIPFPERGYCFAMFLLDLHSACQNIATSSYRVCRQLLALGLFRQPDFNDDVDPQLAWGQRCLYDGQDSTNIIIQCDICPKCHLSNSEMCPIVAPLIREFFNGPLTLLQLARIEIRRLIGVRHFERRVNTLTRQLPPLIFRYIFRADEMLDENPLPNEFYEL